MAVVGSAEVVVRAITSKVKSDIEKAFKDAAPAARAAGQQAGKDFADSFGKSAGDGVKKSIGDHLNDPSIAKDAESGGRTAGAGFSQGFRDELGSLNLGDVGRRLGEDLGNGAANGLGGSGGGGFVRTAERMFGDGGRRAGGAFNRFLDSAWADTAVKASQAFTTIFAMGNIGGAAIGGLVSAISSVVSGLFAMASAAGVAAGALAALPGMMGVLLQAGGALKLAFSGVGDAIGAGFKAAVPQLASTSSAAASAAKAIRDAEIGLARAQEDAARRTADAKRNLQQAYADSARAAADAARRVFDAEQTLADAESNLLSVQKELNAARKEAAENLQQLAFSAEDAALGEQRAQLRLEDAYKALQAVQSLPPDDRSRREAELSYKEAELAYREAKDRSSDLAKEQKKAAKAGISGSKEVVDARNNIKDAEGQVADAVRGVQDARREQAQTAQDNARRIAAAQRGLADAQLQNSRALADAQRALADAQAAANQAAAQGTSQMNAYNQALAGLSKPAQDFVKYLVSLKDEFDALKASAGAELFPKLRQALQPIVDNIFPILERQLRTTGSLLGDAAIGLSDAFTSPEGLTRLQKILKGNNDILEIFTRKGKDGKNSFQQLGTVVLRLLDAVRPITTRFARWIKTLIDAADAATDTKKEMNGLRHFFEKAGDRAALLGRIFKNVIGIITGLGKAGDKAGVGLLKSLNHWLRDVNKFVNSPKGKEKLEHYFDGVAKNMRAIGNLIRHVGRAFGKLGDNQGVADLAKSLEPAADNIGKILDQMTGAGGGLGELLTNLTDLGVVFADTGGMQLFFDILNGALKPIVAFAKSDFGGKFLVVAGAITAALRAFSFIRIVGSKAFQILLGGPIALMRALRTLKEKGLGAAIKGLLGIKPASDEAKNALEKQMLTDKAKTEVLEKLAGAAIEAGAALELLQEKGLPTDSPESVKAAGAAAVADVQVPNAAGAVGSIGAVGDVMDDVGGKKAGIFKKAMGGIGGAFKSLGGGAMALVGGPFGALLIAIPLLIMGFKKLYEKSPEFRKFVDGIVKAVKPVVEWIGKHLLSVLNSFFGWVNKNLPKVKEIFGKVFDAVGKAVGWVVDFIKKHWPLLVGILLGPIGFAVAEIIKHWDKVKAAAGWLWDKVKQIAGWIGDKFKALGGRIADAVRAIRDKFTSFLDKGRELRDFIVDKVVAFMQRRWETFKANIGRIVGWIMGKWNDFKRGAAILRDMIAGVVERLKTKWQEFQDKIGTVIDWVKSKWEDLKTALGNLWESVKGKVDDIKDKFGEIVGSVKDAFQGLASKAAGPLNSFIRFLNSKLIDNVNKITGKFGLTIGHIPEVTGFQKGGYTGRGPANKVAGVVHRDEYVIPSKARRAIEAAHPGALDAMRKTGMLPAGSGSTRGRGGIDLWPGDAPDLGLGKLKDLAGETIGGIKDIGEKIAKEGIGKVLEELVKGASGLMGSAGIKRGHLFNDFFYGIMDALAKKAKEWGGDSGSQPGGVIPTPGTGNLPAYRGPAGGWTYPLAARYPITQMPNQGHNPPWSVDIGSPTGVGVRAVSAGRVVTAADIGDQSYGRYIKIVHNDGSWSLYAHLERMLVRINQIVKTGQSIGVSGAYGHVTGPHLHFELFDALRNTFLAMRKRGVRLARGGIVQATPGGILATIGEAGRNERVEPLAYDGFSARDRAMIDLIKQTIAANQGGKGDQIHVHPSPGMDEAALAMMVARRISWKRSVGT